MAMTREQIKQFLENKGLSVNVRLQGDQAHFKITVKSDFLVPVNDITEGVVTETIVKTKMKNHLGGLFKQLSAWYSNF